jgi:hypothetical protein
MASLPLRPQPPWFRQLAGNSNVFEEALSWGPVWGWLQPTPEDQTLAFLSSGPTTGLSPPLGQPLPAWMLGALSSLPPPQGGPLLWSLESHKMCSRIATSHLWSYHINVPPSQLVGQTQCPPQPLALPAASLFTSLSRKLSHVCMTDLWTPSSAPLQRREKAKTLQSLPDPGSLPRVSHRLTEASPSISPCAKQAVAIRN